MSEKENHTSEDFVPPSKHVAKDKIDNLSITTIYKIDQALAKEGEATDPVVVNRKGPHISIDKALQNIDAILNE